MIVLYTVLINKNLLVLVKASSPCVGPEAVLEWAQSVSWLDGIKGNLK